MDVSVDRQVSEVLALEAEMYRLLHQAECAGRKDWPEDLERTWARSDRAVARYQTAALALYRQLIEAEQ